MQPIEKLRQKMQEGGVPAMLVSDPTNVGWLTGFSGSYGRVIVTPRDAVFITDSRYKLAAKEQVHGMPVETFASPVDGDEFIRDKAGQIGVTALGFEAATTTYSQWERLAQKLDGIALTPVDDLLGGLRMVKAPDEIEKVRHACGIADATFSHIMGRIQPGITEYDLSLEIEFYIRRQGAQLAFPPIVVSGERSARPHGVPSEKRLDVGDFVTMDFGARYEGYNSDITRTVVVGEASDRHRRVYGAVLEAQLAALEALRPGKLCRDVDKVARDVLAGHGLAEYFGHGLGHGLGSIVHDSGRLSPTSDQTVEPGQIWTIEPGVYIPGFGGVRIEDDVVVTATGIDILTHSTKELLELPRV
jgi:Xaa-Pro aminopeptidase